MFEWDTGFDVKNEIESLTSVVFLSYFGQSIWKMSLGNVLTWIFILFGIIICWPQKIYFDI